MAGKSDALTTMLEGRAWEWLGQSGLCDDLPDREAIRHIDTLTVALRDIAEEVVRECHKAADGAAVPGREIRALFPSAFKGDSDDARA